MKWKTKSCVSTSGGCQCHIEKKFGDNIFSWEPGLLSKIQAKCYWFILFCTLLAASLYIYIYIYIYIYMYIYKMLFCTEHKETHWLPEKYIRKELFLQTEDLTFCQRKRTKAIQSTGSGRPCCLSSMSWVLPQWTNEKMKYKMMQINIMLQNQNLW